MNVLRPIFLRPTIITLSTLFTLASCTPSFETTSVKCQTNQNEIVRASSTSFALNVDSEGNIIEAVLDDNGEQLLDDDNQPVTKTDSEYRLYLQDILSSLKDIQAKTDNGDDTLEALNAEQQAALDKMLDLAKTFMSYNINDEGFITSADNPLDFMEYLIASTDSNLIIQAFVDAKKQLASGIESDDGFCIYTNRNIIINKISDSETEDDEAESNETEANEDGTILETISAELRMTYDPFNDFFNQNILLTEDAADLIDANLRTQTPFIGFYESEPSQFKAKGFSPSILRYASMNNAELTETFQVDDGFDSKLGQLEFTTFDTFCTQKDEEGNDVLDTNNQPIVTSCAKGIPTRTPQHTSCDYERDESGNLIFAANEDGSLAYETDEDGSLILQENDNGLLSYVIGDDNRLEFTAVNDSKLVYSTNDDNSLNFEASDTDNVYKDDTGNVIPLPESVPIPTVALISKEAGIRQLRSLPPLVEGNDELSDIQRFRLETDYSTGEVRLYASKYTEAILRQGVELTDINREEPLDLEQVIINPTACEKQAVLDDLADASPGTGVRLTLVEDQAYDITYELDAEGNRVQVNDDGEVVTENGKDKVIEPTPLFTYQGTIIPARQ